MVPTRTITSPFLAETWRTDGILTCPSGRIELGILSGGPCAFHSGRMPDFMRINLNSNRLAIKIVRFTNAILESNGTAKRGQHAESHFCDHLRCVSGPDAGFWPGTGLQQG